jgi:hypothetical protein
LVLQPGTVVEFQDTFGLRVEGVLKSEGKRGDSIYFKPRTGVNMAGRGYTWAGIYYFNNFETDTIRFRFCSFEGVKKGIRNNVTNYAILCKGGSPVVIKNTSFLYNNNKVDQGGYIFLSRNSVILDSLYFQSKATIIRSYLGAVSLDSSLGFDICNLKFNINLSAINYNGELIVSRSISRGVIKNIYNDSNTSLRISIGDCRN